MTVYLLVLVIAAALLLISSVETRTKRVNLIALGLFFWVLAAIVKEMSGAGR